MGEEPQLSWAWRRKDELTQHRSMFALQVVCCGPVGEQLLWQPGGPVRCVWWRPQCGSALPSPVYHEWHFGRRAAENKKRRRIHGQHVHRYAKVKLRAPAVGFLILVRDQILKGQELNHSSDGVCVCTHMCMRVLSRVQPPATPWTVQSTRLLCP